MFKIRSIQKKLIISHIAIVLVFAFISGVVFFLYTSSVIRGNVLAAYSNMVKSTSGQLDIFIHDMDNLSRNIISSHVYYDRNMFFYLQNDPDLLLVPGSDSDNVSNYFFIHPNAKISTEYSEMYSILKDRNIVNVINSLNGPEMRCKQILLFDIEGNFFSAPFKNSMLKEEIKQKISGLNWVAGVFSDNGSKRIIPPHFSDWSQANEFVISLVRSFNNIYQNNKGIIEVQQDYSKLRVVIDLVTGDKSDSVYVIDDNNSLIFPTGKTVDEQSNLYRYLYNATNDKKSNQKVVINPNTNQNETLIYNYSEYSGWTTIYAIADNVLYTEANKFRSWFISIFIVLLSVTFALAYLASNSITNPMKLLYKLIKKTDLSNLFSDFSDPRLESTVQEVSEVYKAFIDVRISLNKAMNESIEARSNEAKAHWIALQAQMNPHFLYNILSVISVTSEEGDAKKVTYMCKKLSSMLKYVTRFTAFKTYLRHEVDYATDYLELMKVRYEDYLTYHINLSGEMMGIEVPKLVLQPLVENCINHGFRDCRPPWEIFIIGRMEDDKWELTVSDNGCGMELNKMESIRKEVLEYGSIDSINERDEAEENGLGLKNTLIRLKLMYKDLLYYKMENNQNGGFSVSFGAFLNNERGKGL